MKTSLRVLRLSRKVLLIIVGTLLLSGAAGAAALYIGRASLLGTSGGGVNGADCTSVRVTTIHKKDRFWIRKYIKTEAADGLTRVKTALRVAGAVFEKERPDLVQVIVLDLNGPEKRADMRGRAIGADVIFVAEPERLAATADMPQFTATYTDAPASINGEFFGEKRSMNENDIGHLVTSITEKTDCVDPAADAAAKDKSAEGKSEEAKTSEGETSSAESEAGTGSSSGTPEAEKSGAAKGWFASLKAMVLGAEEAAEPAEAGKAEQGATVESDAGAASDETPEAEAAAPMLPAVDDPFAPAALSETPPRHEVPVKPYTPEADAGATPHG